MALRIFSGVKGSWSLRNVMGGIGEMACNIFAAAGPVWTNALYCACVNKYFFVIRYKGGHAPPSLFFYFSTFFRIRLAFVPPNPNELLMATSTLRFFATFGTRSKLPTSSSGSFRLMDGGKIPPFFIWCSVCIANIIWRNIVPKHW